MPLFKLLYCTCVLVVLHARLGRVFVRARVCLSTRVCARAKIRFGGTRHKMFSISHKSICDNVHAIS